MSELIIKKNGHIERVSFNGEFVLDDLIKKSGLILLHPCNGNGKCGKCAVEVSGAVSEPNEIEKQFGHRLSCQATVYGDATVILPNSDNSFQIETDILNPTPATNPLPGKYGAAVDIGTTTVAMKVYELQSGNCIGTAAELNPQTTVSADVLGRIDAAMNGKLSVLQDQIVQSINRLLKKAFNNNVTPDVLVITGNTTMLYLLCGINPNSLSVAPFEADNLFGIETDLFGCPAYIAPCMNAFVGADITCALLACDICKSNDTALFCDIGTNGEIALWKNGVLYVTSTAAGPAFEGAGITCGCGSIEGAIDSVDFENGKYNIHTIGNMDAVGICGSGIIDAVAAGIISGVIDKTGAMEDALVLSNNVQLQPRDIRAVQLAKAAVSAGIETLLEASNTEINEIKTFYISGGFGSRLNAENATIIGLFPKELMSRIKVVGNAALSGAVRVLLNKTEKTELERIASLAEHISLGGNPSFNDKYISSMYF